MGAWITHAATVKGFCSCDYLRAAISEGAHKLKIKELGGDGMCLALLNLQTSTDTNLVGRKRYFQVKQRGLHFAR